MRAWATRGEVADLQRQVLDLLRQIVELRGDNAALAKQLRVQDASAAELGTRVAAIENGQRPPLAPVGFGYTRPLRPAEPLEVLKELPQPDVHVAVSPEAIDEVLR